MAIKAVLFDMDGTIIDSEDIHTKALRETVKEEIGIDLSEEELRVYIGLDYEHKLDNIFKKRNMKVDCKKLADIVRIRSLENFHIVKKMDGAEEIIKKMKENFK